MIHNIVNVLNSTIHLKMVQMLNFMLCIFYHNKTNIYLKKDARGFKMAEE